MNYKVVWKKSAEDRLAEIWLSASDRNAVSDAAYLIEKRLAANPLNVGESRDGDIRIAFEGPLSMLFVIRDQKKLVRVLAVAPASSRR